MMLNGLVLRGYRSFDVYRMTGVARVNLVVGMNNSGKTSILEAIELLVSGDPSTLRESALRRNEFTDHGADISHVFYGHTSAPGTRFELAGHDNRPQLTATILLPDDAGDAFRPGPARLLRIDHGERTQILQVDENGVLPNVTLPGRHSRAARFLDFDVRSMNATWNSVLAEGRSTEVFVIESLLRRHGVDFAHVEIKATEKGEGTGGKDTLLQGMNTAVTTATGRSVGFVLDADDEPESRWRAVRRRLDGTDLVLPEEIPDGGFVGDTPTYQSRVGVWLMPDNQRSGALEEFLMDLVATEDRRLLLLARAATRGAVCLGAELGKARRRKAVLHAWLAWQRRPGLPYGMAITARYLGHDSPAALGFVEWFQRVFPEPAMGRR